MKKRKVLIIGSIIVGLLIFFGVMIKINTQKGETCLDLSEPGYVKYNKRLIENEDEDVVDGKTVKKLISRVNAINSNKNNQNNNIWVKLISEGENKVDLGETVIKNSKKRICTYKASGILNKKTYSISAVSYADDRRIDEILITEN